MKIYEIMAMKMSVAQKLTAVAVGQKPDEASQKLLQKMGDATEKIVLKRVLNNPDNYGLDYDVTKKEIRESAHPYTQRVDLCKNGFSVEANIDLDDIGGGGSTNYDSVLFGLDGKLFPGDSVGEPVATFNAQDGWTREEE